MILISFGQVPQPWTYDSSVGFSPARKQLLILLSNNYIVFFSGFFIKYVYNVTVNYSSKKFKSSTGKKETLEFSMFNIYICYFLLLLSFFLFVHKSCLICLTVNPAFVLVKLLSTCNADSHQNCRTATVLPTQL